MSVPMPDDAILRDFARAAISDRKLPRRNPACIWDGPGIGATCPVCGVPVTRRRSWCLSSRARMTAQALSHTTFTFAASWPGRPSASGRTGRDDRVSRYCLTTRRCRRPRRLA
jgi:hypothetical protein